MQNQRVEWCKSFNNKSPLLYPSSWLIASLVCVSTTHSSAEPVVHDVRSELQWKLSKHKRETVAKRKAGAVHSATLQTIEQIKQQLIRADRLELAQASALLDQVREVKDTLRAQFPEDTPVLEDEPLWPAEKVSHRL